MPESAGSANRAPLGGGGVPAATGEPVALEQLLDLAADESHVRNALRTVIDPELGINLLDLGLVYGIEVRNGIARVTLTTTTPACPIGSFLEDQVRWAVLRLDGILDVEVQVVHEPRWTPARMTDDARRALGWTG